MRAKSVWSLLQRNQDRVVVGAATTLVMLALLAQARSGFVSTDAVHETVSAKVSPLSDVSRDPEVYRKKWRQIAADFYAAHPVEPESQAGPAIAPLAKSPQVITASLSDQVDGESSLGPKISTVAHATQIPAVEPMFTPAVMLAQRRIELIGPPAVFAAIAAGLLVSLAYCSLWPMKPARQNHGLACSDSLRIELPSRWVRVRPAPFQRLKSIVLAVSYTGGIVAAWSIISQ